MAVHCSSRAGRFTAGGAHRARAACRLERARDRRRKRRCPSAPTPRLRLAGVVHRAGRPDVAVRLLRDRPRRRGPAGEDERQRSSQACFVVRAAPAPRSALLLATNTYNAYNQWGGHCLYSGADRVSSSGRWSATCGVRRRPTRNRPTAARQHRVGSGRGAPPAPVPPTARVPAVVRRAGGTAGNGASSVGPSPPGSPSTTPVNSDLELHPEVLDGHRLLLSVGHDEYWSWGMRDSADAFVDAGGSWGIFSGTPRSGRCATRTRAGPWCATRAGPTRTILWRTDDRRFMTTMWSAPAIGRPESLDGPQLHEGGYARVGEATPRARAATPCTAPSTRSSTAPASATATCSAPMTGSWPTRSTAASSPRSTDCRCLRRRHTGRLRGARHRPRPLLSITADHCEAPAALWGTTRPPGDLEAVAMVLFGDASPANVASRWPTVTP